MYVRSPACIYVTDQIKMNTYIYKSNRKTVIFKEWLKKFKFQIHDVVITTNVICAMNKSFYGRQFKLKGTKAKETST